MGYGAAGNYPIGVTETDIDREFGTMTDEEERAEREAAGEKVDGWIWNELARDRKERTCGLEDFLIEHALGEVLRLAFFEASMRDYLPHTYADTGSVRDSARLQVLVEQWKEDTVDTIASRP